MASLLRFKCPLCEVAFWHHRTLEDHLADHHGSTTMTAQALPVASAGGSVSSLEL